MLAYGLLLGALAYGSYAQSSSAAGFMIESSSAAVVTAGPTQTVVPLYIPASATGHGQVASVVNVDGCETTYGIRCLARDTISSVVCDPLKTVSGGNLAHPIFKNVLTFDSRHIGRTAQVVWAFPRKSRSAALL